jgi:hypothetical protein
VLDCIFSTSSQLHILHFNARGLGERWEEVLLLLDKYKIDCICLNEVGNFERHRISQWFTNYKYYYQRGENSWGGVMTLIRTHIPVSRIRCDFPNLCVVDVKLEKSIRLINMYAPKSKSWEWDCLSQFITNDCCLIGDFNIDITKNKDESNTSKLLHWSESMLLVPIVPVDSTSLRSDRIIDFAFVKGLEMTIQTCTDNTTSDHRPVLGILKVENKDGVLGSNTHWKVFNTFLSLTYEYWEQESYTASSEDYYSNFITLLDRLKSRCTTYYPLKKYRAAIPKELRMKLSLVRALSFRYKRTGDAALYQKILKMKKENRDELTKLRSNRLDKSIKERFAPPSPSNTFWSKARKNFKSTSSLSAFIDNNDKVIKDNNKMLSLAAEHYEELFRESEVYRPHPYVDGPVVMQDNYEEKIPPITMNELMKVVAKVKKKHSTDAHGISPFMLQFLPNNYFLPILKIFNDSFTKFAGPSHWKQVKMKLLAKKNSICPVNETRPISLLDIFLKILERLFLSRFQKVLINRGILDDSQSGFRSNYRLQTRVLTLIDQISSLMSTSAPAATLFVDFRQAFDQLWWEGCMGKFRNIGIPNDYVTWIDS